ncbi:hypothetical protein V6N11_052988 [Hibiscus sabdariffa]|uniref:Uncharacterized protein n=1 Tax=Hibiscus sabdariffa TaxID=183260 RepID=A0ABR2UBQ3_9ROSI
MEDYSSTELKVYSIEKGLGTVRAELEETKYNLEKAREENVKFKIEQGTQFQFANQPSFTPVFRETPFPPKEEEEAIHPFDRRKKGSQ